MKIKNILEDAVVNSTTSSFYGKIARLMLKWYLNVFVASKNEYYDYNIPSEDNMKDKTYWIQITSEKGA